MCRLMACPANFSRQEAINVLLDFQKGNLDGVGYAYVKDGEFVVRKHAKPLSKVLRKDPTFLDHMPHNGWTIIHLRAASHGVVKKANTHPFVVNDWCVCHNGVWSGYRIAKACFSACGVQFEGETDSEVAANLLARVGPATFVDTVDFAGVYLALKKDGSLYTIKTSGDLEFVTRGSTVVAASEFDDQQYPTKYESLYGWAKFDAAGTLLEKHPTTFETNVSHTDPDRSVFESEFAEPFANGFAGFGGFGDMKVRPAGRVLGMHRTQTEPGYRQVETNGDLTRFHE